MDSKEKKDSALLLQKMWGGKNEELIEGFNQYVP